MKKKLAILDDYEDAARSTGAWDALADKIELHVLREHVSDEAAVAAQLADCEIVFAMRERTPFPASLIERLPKLELIITSGMRNASIDLAAAKANNVVVSGTPILPYPAAEHAWALLLALAKRIPADDQRMRTGRWGEGLNIGLNGKTLGVIGLGKLGAQVAQVGLAFGMNVIAWSTNLSQARCDEVGVQLASKAALLSTSDFISIHLVLGERSRGLIGADEFAQMKSTAFLLNTSRGPIVDEAALLSALEAGAIAGAGLDVFATEPLPKNHELRLQPNVVLTPHQGYVTEENFEGFHKTAAALVEGWLNGRRDNLLT